MDALVAAMDHGISKQAISKYENNKMLPDSRILIALGKALSVHPDFFFSQVDLPLDAVNFRKKANLDIKAVDSLKARVKDELECQRRFDFAGLGVRTFSWTTMQPFLNSTGTEQDSCRPATS